MRTKTNVLFLRTFFSVLNQTADVYTTFILVQLIGSMILLSCTIFQIDLVIRDLGTTIIVLIFATSVDAMKLFLYCYYGKCVTECYAAFADCLYESKWMILPNNLQKWYLKG